MSFKELIKTIKFGQVKQLVIWFFKHPFFLIATIYATVVTLKISQIEFPDIHGKHNKANAFRHALWNILICKYCAKFSANQVKIIEWTKGFTDWHEDFSVNEKLPRLMDLHNNKIGRKKFLEFGITSKKEILLILKKEIYTAILIKQNFEFSSFENNLVYLEE